MHYKIVTFNGYVQLPEGIESVKYVKVMARCWKAEYG